MQFMYLRRNGKTKNPGNHPFGTIGVVASPDMGFFAIHSAIIVSGDRFDKKVGRDIIVHKFNTVSCISMARYITNDLIINESEPLRFVLNKSVYNRISDKARANAIFKSIIADEVTKKNRQAVQENGCAP